MNNTPSKEELWLLCLKGKCANVNDTGLEYLQASFKEFVKNLLVICCTVAAHESRTTILCRDVIHCQEILFRQRENSTIRISGFLLNTSMMDDDDDSSADMDRSDYFEEEGTASDSNSDQSIESDVDDDDSYEEEKGVCVTEVETTLPPRQVQEQIQELTNIIEVESEADIDEIERNQAMKELITSKLISLRSYLHLFKATSLTKFISVDAFNMVTGVCEHQVQQNLQGENSLLQVVYEDMIVPIGILMKLTHLQNEENAVSLSSKFLVVEKECLSSLTIARHQQKELISVLQSLLISQSRPVSSLGSDVLQSGPPDDNDQAQIISSLQQRLIVEKTTTTFLNEQLQESRKTVKSLQDVLKEVNELTFILRSLTCPRSDAGHACRSPALREHTFTKESKLQD